MQHAIQFNAMQPRNPARNVAGLAVVIMLHAGILLAALYGLNRADLRIALPAQLEWVTIVTPPPTPPPVAHRSVLPTPLMHAMPTNIAPVEVPIEIAVPAGDAISVQASSANVGGPSGTRSEAAAASSAVGIACPNAQAVRATMRYPAQARREGLEGNVMARFIVGAAGGIRNIEIVSSSHRAFNGAVVDAVKQFGCVGQGQDVSVEVPFNFRLE